MRKNILRILKSGLILGLIVFAAVWYFGVIQINGATFNIADASVTTYWNYEEEDKDPFPIIPMRSRQIYEDAFVGMKPDFNQMLNDYISGETMIGISAIFPDGKAVKSPGTDFDVCVYPENLSIEKTNIKPFLNRYNITDKNAFDIDYKRPNYARHRLDITHSSELSLEVEVNGIVSESYLDYKLKEIYLYYTLDAIREHLHQDKTYFKHEYLDTLENLIFVKDNFKISREEFKNLDPTKVNNVHWIRSREARDLYTKEPDYGVLIATTN